MMTFGTQQNSVVSERVARKGFNMEMVKVQRRSCLFEQRYVVLQNEGKIKISCFSAPHALCLNYIYL